MMSIFRIAPTGATFFGFPELPAARRKPVSPGSTASPAAWPYRVRSSRWPFLPNRSPAPARAAVGVALAAAFLLVWVNGAGGIIGSENNPANLMYAGVLAVGIVGAVIARFRPNGMARALLATASAFRLRKLTRTPGEWQRWVTNESL